MFDKERQIVDFLYKIIDIPYLPVAIFYLLWDLFIYMRKYSYIVIRDKEYISLYVLNHKREIHV